MTDVPKIVHQRLRATTPEQMELERAHPEADVLTAFAEQALSGTEREGVLLHLAVCADCRDVGAMSLPAMEATAVAVESGAEAALPDGALTSARGGAIVRPRFGWLTFGLPSLRWAALAAGIAVAALVGPRALEYLSKPKTEMTPVARQTGAPATLTTAAEARSPSLVPSDSPTAKVNVTASPADVMTPSPVDKLSAVNSSLQTAGNRGIGGTLKSRKGGSLRARDNSTPSAKQAAPAPSAEFSLAASRPAQEKVASGDPGVQMAEASTNSFLVNGVDAAPVVRAKPPLEAEVNEASKTANASSPQAILPLQGGNTLVVNANAAQAMSLKRGASWMISGGVLERSLDGQKWETVAQALHPLLCYADRGRDVWAGGQAGTLLHSTDGGATWATVGVSFNGQPMSSDITHIEMRGLSEIILSAGTQENWISGDGGKTWKKI